MSLKPESKFIGRINKHLPLKRVQTSLKAREQHPQSHWLHYEKMNNPYRSGGADSWYSGKKSDIWIEYKYLARTPQRADVWPANPNETLLSRMQLDWLNERHEEGRQIAVVIGCPDGAVVFSDRRWENKIPAKEFVSLLNSEKQVAEWILSHTI